MSPHSVRLNYSNTGLSPTHCLTSPFPCTHSAGAANASRAPHAVCFFILCPACPISIYTILIKQCTVILYSWKCLTYRVYCCACSFVYPPRDTCARDARAGIFAPGFPRFLPLSTSPDRAQRGQLQDLGGRRVEGRGIGAARAARRGFDGLAVGVCVV